MDLVCASWHAPPRHGLSHSLHGESQSRESQASKSPERDAGGKRYDGTANNASATTADR